jgi:FAD/FMN-containing dehydrogenase
VHTNVADGLLAALRTVLGDRVTAAASVRDHHSRGESYHTPAAPDLVAFPHTTEETSAVVRICAERDVPIIPFGAGTSLEGHSRGGRHASPARLTSEEHRPDVLRRSRR